jgi:tripartite-type tricarboxylate transporter receptor subunit TctC
MIKLVFLRRFNTSVLAILLAIGMLGGCAQGGGDSESMTPAEFYKGKKIRWIIPYSPGGGYDEYARLIAPYLEKYTGARVDILNLPGAGGMRGANDLFTAPKNGLTIGLINGSALVANELAEMSGAEYRIAEFDYLGRIVADRRVFSVTLESGFNSIEDLWKAGSSVKIGATGLGGSTYLDAVIVNEAFGLDLNIVHGFDSSSVVRQAMLRGNIAGTWGSWGSALDSVDNGAHHILLQSGRTRLPELPDVPTALELVDLTDNPERTKRILSAWETLHEVGRPLAAPPGTQPERLQFLRDSFRSAMTDPELLEKSSKLNRTLDYATAEEMQRVIRESIEMPDDLKILFVKAIRGEL